MQGVCSPSFNGTGVLGLQDPGDVPALHPDRQHPAPGKMIERLEWEVTHQSGPLGQVLSTPIRIAPSPPQS